jgi:hypothetical protein
MMLRISSHKKKLKQECGIVNWIGTRAWLQIFQAKLDDCFCWISWHGFQPSNEQASPGA